MSLSHRHRTDPQSAPVVRRRQDGYVMTVFGLMLVPLLLMAGLAVDVGYWYNRASDIQKAADAASLAGVVWLPDMVKAASVAKDVAARNGFDDAAANIVVSVTRSAKSPRRLKVLITDTTVGSFFYKNLGGRNIGLSRTSFAEFVTPVPMGSPRNYFGTGPLLTGNQELLYQSVNPYCTSKVNGDRHQSGHYDPLNADGSTLSSCPAAPSNTDHRTGGYELYIDAKAGRPSAIQVRLYDPRYNESPVEPTPPAGSPSVAADEPCRYVTRWQSFATDLGSVQVVAGPIYYWNGSAYVYLPDGQSVSARYVVRQETVWLCVGPDSKRRSGNEDYTFSLYSPDNTPLDDSDNPLKCSKTFSRDTAFDGYTYLGSRRWNTLCDISTSDATGRYILRVKNAGTTANTADGSNQWGVVAKYAGSTGNGTCDGRTDTLCPRVYGKDAISVFANTAASTASFFLAEIGPEHAGKKLKLELWDPGEGGSTIQIMKPKGTNSFTPVDFTWKVGTGTPATTNTLDVTNSVFNGKLVEITVDLTGYAPPADNEWWQIRYTFTSGTVTDRTTWSARIIGDPVHLTEEN